MLLGCGNSDLPAGLLPLVKQVSAVAGMMPEIAWRE